MTNNQKTEEKQGIKIKFTIDSLIYSANNLHFDKKKAHKFLHTHSFAILIKIYLLYRLKRSILFLNQKAHSSNRDASLLPVASCNSIFYIKAKSK